MTEYLLKGVYLGLLLLAALQEPNLAATAVVAGCTVAGLALALAAAGWSKFRAGYRVQRRLPAFLLFLLLESPELVYAGVIAGTLLGIYLALPRPEGIPYGPLAAAVGGGAALGFVFAGLRIVRNRWVRLGLSLLLAAGLVGGVLVLFPEFELAPAQIQLRWQNPVVFGVQLLLGIPVFYLLTFAGRSEESEVEIGAMAAVLALGVSTLAADAPSIRSTGFLLALMLYFYYTTRLLPGIRVFKLAARGFSYSKVGRYRLALLSFRRALQLDPQNALAREGLWGVHRAMDSATLSSDPDIVRLLDLELCLERAGALLLASAPSPDQLLEAHHLLDLVLNQKPELRAAVDYWRAVAFTHARQYDRAAEALEHVLDPGNFAPGDAPRLGVLLPAWQLGLTLHPEMQRRVGSRQLMLPGRRMEAVAAVERHLTATPDDATVWDLKRILYGGLTETEFLAAVQAQNSTTSAAPGGVATVTPPEAFDYGYVQQLGLALINDPARWQRGAEYLRMAAAGLPAQGPTIFQQIAGACEKAGDADGAWRHLDLAKRAGLTAGVKTLTGDDRQTYFAVFKQLAERARARGDLAAAIENYHLSTENERSGVETLRTLADLYEQNGEAFGALRATEQALLYNAKDKDLLARKDKYYYSVMPEQLAALAESARGGFDVDYCLRKARSLLDVKDGDLDLIDWAQHLVDLALVVKPDSVAGKVLRARALRRRGEIEAYQAVLEDVYNNKPVKFATGADEDAWFLACRLLGEMYLYELGRADLAVACFNDFRKSAKSGADTLYKLGQAYENLGDRARAAKFYEQVTSYDSHPLAPDAREALYRMKSG